MADKKNGNKSYEELARNNPITLSDGTEVNVDLYKVAWREINVLFSINDEDRYADVVSRIIGIDKDKFLDLPYPDAKLISKTVGKAVTNLVEYDPN
jgi:hypothetical protein